MLFVVFLVAVLLLLLLLSSLSGRFSASARRGLNSSLGQSESGSGRAGTEFKRGASTLARAQCPRASPLAEGPCLPCSASASARPPKPPIGKQPVARRQAGWTDNLIDRH